MNGVNDHGEPPNETPQQLLARLLRCPKVKATVCKVARSQGVPRHEEEDVYQETMLRVSKGTLPPVEEEARKYINGTAKFAAIDHMRQRAEQRAVSLEVIKSEERPVRERIEQRAHMKGLFAQGFAVFGVKWDWWVRSKVQGETSEEIGEAAGVKASTVRHEVSVMSRWFDAAWGKKTGSIGGVLALLLVVSGAKLAWDNRGWVPESQVSAHVEARTEAEPRTGMGAEELRARGRKACDAGAWGACENDLAAAAAIDPQGETPEVWAMRVGAIAKQMRDDAEGGGGSEMNAKPPR